MSVAPRPPPEGILTKKQYDYFTKAVCICVNVPCNILNCEFLDNYLFGSPPKGGRMLVTVMWKSQLDGEGSGRIMMMYHVVCARILRRKFDCEAQNMESVYNLCEIDHVLGPAMTDVNAGRLPHVKYEEAGPEKVDVRPYYYLDEDEQIRLDWVRFKKDGFEWTYTRPDIFPRFHRTVLPSRFPGPKPGGTNDVLTTKPFDILHILLPYLTDKAFVSLLSTCRTLRHHALTTLQPQARERVIAHGWAIPLRKEYAAAPQVTREAGVMIDPDNAPLEGDWMLYLCNVHKSQSMRARRWIWATADELRRAYVEQKVGSPFADIVAGDAPDAPRVKSPTRLRFERDVRNNPMGGRCPPDW
ncbi:hypothetical protein NM688_g5490 [Phlebia brevispora]|uniref:Uncharacterized protein n=1 Tax=Phlebia brevispora TaxID=194682 RepID=A0ACC1SUL9_9APHY|nr:hypothetical protein NM688_g5490 [Phlebia brevispora]